MTEDSCRSFLECTFSAIAKSANIDYAALTSEFRSARSEWLEDILAGLLAAGTSKEAIDVQYHPDLSIVVCVLGEWKYQWPPTRYDKPTP